jgi:hypothetical protein
MPQNAFVTLKGGIVQSVEDYNVVEEVPLDAYYDGSTYRDIFQHGAMNQPSVISGSSWYPAADGQAYNSSFGATQALKARLSDEIAHTPPRVLAVKQTRLRFYQKGEETVETIFGPSNTIFAPGAALQPGDIVSFYHVDESNPAPGFTREIQAALDGVGGIVAGEIYVVRGSVGDAFSVSTTRGGVEVDITLPGGATVWNWSEIGTEAKIVAQYLKCIADFKPSEWKVWSNARPVRF